MYSLEVDENFVPDLRDDFVMNDEKDLYEFIGGNVVSAFYLGYNIEEWFQELDREQKYLYSKQIRHCKEEIEDYKDQIEFWTNKFSKDEEEIDLGELAEYIINNIFIDSNSDLVKIAFFFGRLISIQNNKQESDIILQLDNDDNIIKEWDRKDSFEGFNKTAVMKCCRGQQGSHKGYKWKFK